MTNQQLVQLQADLKDKAKDFNVHLCGHLALNGALRRKWFLS